MNDKIIKLNNIVEMSELADERVLDFVGKTETADFADTRPDYADTDNQAEEEKNFEPEKQISDKAFEEALEKVVKKMFADKIDAILEKVIEITVTREIKILKQSLIDL